MKKLGWVFFILTIGLALYLGYFYNFIHLPMVNKTEALERENRILKDSLLNVIRKLPATQKPEEPVTALPLNLKYDQKNFFKGNTEQLSTQGEEALKKLYNSLLEMVFDSVQIILYPGEKNQSARALAIKRYLVSQGIEEEKIKALVSKSGEKNLIILRVK